MRELWDTWIVVTAGQMRPYLFDSAEEAEGWLFAKLGNGSGKRAVPSTSGSSSRD